MPTPAESANVNVDINNINVNVTQPQTPSNISNDSYATVVDPFDGADA